MERERQKGNKAEMENDANILGEGEIEREIERKKKQVRK